MTSAAEGPRTAIALVICPAWSMDCPSLALATLASHVRGRTRHRAVCFDFNGAFYRAAGPDRRYWDDLGISTIFWRDEASVLRLIGRHQALFDRCVSDILESGCPVVGFTVYLPMLRFSLELARAVKRRDPSRIVVFGGHECAREYAGMRLSREDAVDAVALGEGEAVLGLLLDGVAAQGRLPAVPGLILNLGKGRIQDCGDAPPLRELDAVPFADYSDFAEDLSAGRFNAAGALGIAGSRGCARACRYCDQWRFWDRYRSMGGERIYEEMRHQVRTHPGTRRFYFMSLLVNGAPQSLERFCDLMISEPLGVRWWGQADVRPEMTPALVRKMAAAGCAFLAVGIESGSERIRRRMNKSFTNDEACAFLGGLKDAGIDAQANFMFGLPGEEAADFRETLAFLERARPWLSAAYASTRFCYIYRGSYIYEHAEEFGILDREQTEFWETADGSNTYLVRLRRYEEFCRLARRLDLPFCHRRISFPKWFLLGSYFAHKGEPRRAARFFRRSARRESVPEIALARLGALEIPARAAAAGPRP
ncbi:MAG: radical SAM protein [Elusimicrobia bacterium]|nr:radical SAM protein [Elusimicrobiota bacterium]